MSRSFECRQVAEGVWSAAVPLAGRLVSVNAYLLADRDEAFLVDTAYVPGGDWEHVPELMKAASVDPAQLRGIVLTHTHIDHVGHIRSIENWAGVPAKMHPDEKLTSAWAAPESHGRFQAWLLEQGVDPETRSTIAVVLARGREPLPRWPEPVMHGQLLTIGTTTWRLLHTPGHTPGHLCLFRESDGTLLTGDHLLPETSPNVSVRPGQPFNPLGRYLNALRMIGELPVRLALPGHGLPITNMASIVLRRISHHERRLTEVGVLTGTAPLTGFEVALGMRWVHGQMHLLDLAPRHQFLALGETLAHLVALEARGILERTSMGAIVGWRHRS